MTDEHKHQLADIFVIFLGQACFWLWAAIIFTGGTPHWVLNVTVLGLVLTSFLRLFTLMMNHDDAPRSTPPV